MTLNLAIYSIVPDPVNGEGWGLASVSIQGFEISVFTVRVEKIEGEWKWQDRVVRVGDELHLTEAMGIRFNGTVRNIQPTDSHAGAAELECAGEMGIYGTLGLIITRRKDGWAFNNEKIEEGQTFYFGEVPIIP